MHQVFTRKEALAAGIEGRQLRGRRYRALSRGLYCRADAAPSETQIVAALLRKLPAAEFACRQTAAVLLGAVVPRSSVVHLGSVERRSSKRDDVQLHWYRKPPTLTERGGIDVTTGAQTFADLSTELPFVDLLVLGDSLVQAGAMTIEQLAETSFDHRTGASSARAVAGLVRAGVESPYESRTRLLLVSAGLPEPLVNHPIRTTRATSVGASTWRTRSSRSRSSTTDAITSSVRASGAATSGGARNSRPTDGSSSSSPVATSIASRRTP